MHLVDHVEQDRPTASLPAPWPISEVFIRLEEYRAAHHGDQLSEPAFVDQLLRARHDRAVCPMVTDQDLCARLVGLFHERLGFPNGRRDRLFQQLRHARGDALQRVFEVQLVWRCENHAIGTILVEQLVERLVQRHAGLGGNDLCGRRRVDDSR